MKDNQIKELPVPAGEVYDEADKLIGKYVYLLPKDQNVLDQFCKSWLDTYDQDNKFFLTIDIETTGLKPHAGQILLFSISWNGKESIIFSPYDFNLDLFKEVLQVIPINNQNIKFDLKWILYHMGIECNIYFDTMVAAQLGWAGCFPEKSFGLGNLAKQLLSGFDLEKETRKEFIGMKLEDGFTKNQIEYAVKDSLITHRLVYPIKKRLYNQDLWKVWEEIEKPLISVLIRSEVKGVLVDTEEVKNLLAKKEKELALIKQRIAEEIQLLPAETLTKFPKGEFNPASPKQIVDILSIIGLKVSSTDKSTLQSLDSTNHHPLLSAIIDWRSTKGIVSKFLTKWLEEHIDPATNCIYTTFNTNLAATGRLSASSPNLQQLMKEMRAMIISRLGWNILSLDYSQFESRSVAGLSQEQSLIDTFEERFQLLPLVKKIANKYGAIDADDFIKDVSKGKKTVTTSELEIINQFSLTDIHKRNAAMALGKEIKDVTTEDRSVGKCVSLETYVHTEKGIEKVKDLLPKKLKKDTFYDLKDVKVLTDSGFKESPQIYFNGKSKALRITTVSGRNITCSPNHKFRTVDHKGKYIWIMANKLKIDKDIFLKTNAPILGCKEKLPLGIKTNESFKILASIVAMFLKTGSLDGSTILLAGSFYSQLKDKLSLIPDLVKASIYQPTKKEGYLTINSLELSDYLRNLSGIIPKEFLTTNQEGVLELLVKILSDICPLGYCLGTNNSDLLRQLMNITTRWGCPGYVASPNHTKLGKPTILIHGVYQEILKAKLEELPIPENKNLMTWKAGSPTKIYSKILEQEFIDDISKVKNIENWLKSFLTLEEFETAKFLYDNDLRRDKIVSISEVADCDMADLVVPDNNTVVYEGFVCHNTINYSVLYGAGADKMRESLAKEKYYRTNQECVVFLKQYFENLPRVKNLIDSAQQEVLDKGFLSTIMGRKRFFVLPPKYLSRKYEQEKQAAFREAPNFLMQGANADATKKSMVMMDDVFRKYPEEVRPIILLTVHDEIVIEAHNSNSTEVGEIAEKIMIECGLEAVDHKVKIEVSKNISTRWSH